MKWCNERVFHILAITQVFICLLKGTPRKCIMFKRNNILLIEVSTNIEYTWSIIDRISSKCFYIFLGVIWPQWEVKNKI